MFIPAKGYIPSAGDTADVMLNEHEFFGFCETFKYLGTTFDNKLDGSTDIQVRIRQATAAFASMKKLLQDQKLSNKMRVRSYEATVLNILLFGCESWALKAEDRRRLEVFHHRCLRSMLRISIYDVKEYHIRNSSIREELGCYSLHQQMELRRARWLEKVANMGPTRNPRKILVAWTPHSRPRGRPKKTIRHAYADTLQQSLDVNPSLHEWIPMAADHGRWASQVEEKIRLKQGTYKPFKDRRNGQQQNT